jgi:hypothetical protein
MSKERLRIDEQRCRNLMNEFASAEWSDKILTKPKRKDNNDHSLNAFEYFFEPEMMNGYIVSIDDKEQFKKDYISRKK